MNCNQSDIPFVSWLRMGSLAIGSVVFFTVLIGGCTDSSSNGQPDFVVVDVISVARALGRDEIIQQKLEEANALLNDQLTQISTSLEQQLREEQSRLDESKSPANRQKIDNLTLQTQLKLRQSQLLAKQKAEQFRSKLLSDFREEVLKAASGIAKGRRALSIQIANNDLLWYDPSVDITAEVIKVLRASENRVESNVTEKKRETESRSDSSTEPKTSENSDQVQDLNQLMDAIATEDKSKP
ncbi:MAG: OmpH family outer membrane protein [Methylococcales bacterium]